MKKVLALMAIAFLLGSCNDSGYSMKKYEQYSSDGELQDVVHEWIGNYVESYCRVAPGGSITCR